MNVSEYMVAHEEQNEPISMVGSMGLKPGTVPPTLWAGGETYEDDDL
jgi:hypothetical protein